MNIAGRAGFSCDDLVRCGGPLSAEAAAVLRTHPLLTSAVGAAAGAVVAMTRRRRAIIGDLGRLVIGNLALYLHFSRDPADPRSGLSASRIRALCVEQKVCSRGRALAVVAAMRRAGHLAVAPRQVDRRLRLLVPTGQLITACRLYWDAIFRGMALVIPGRCDAIAALEREDVLAAFLRVFGGYFCGGTRMFPPGAGLTPFAQRNAGLAMLFDLLLASGQMGAASAPVSVRISIADLARRFAVSRPQVVLVLDDAAKAALIERSDPDGLRITVLPRLRSATEGFYVTAFLLCDHYLWTASQEVRRG